MSKFSNKRFLIDYRMDKENIEYFDKNNINYLTTEKKEELYEEIDGHPDIVSCNIGNITVLEPNTYKLICDKSKKYNATNNAVISGSTVLKSRYPYDIAYNFIATDKYIIGKTDYMDDVIKLEAQKRNLTYISVKQGYARCSTISLPGNVFITSDKNIHLTLISKNIKSYYIETNDIYLSERYRGFLGGSCMQYQDEILFFGDVEKLFNYYKLKKIFDEYNIKHECISKNKLTDYGSAIII